MGYLGKNINLTLLIIMIGVIILLVAVTLFFQLGIQERTEDFELTSTNLSTCQEALNNYQNRFVEAQEQINSTAQDIRRYDQLYENKVAELSEKGDELSTANNRIQTLELIKASLESDKTALEQQTRVLEQEKTQLTTEIADLEDDVDYWKDRFSDCKADPEDC